MAVKTITIDIEAYDILAKQKTEGESFSEVIKRRLKKKSTASTLLDNLMNYSLDEDALNHVEDIIKRRENSLLDSEPVSGE